MTRLKFTYFVAIVSILETFSDLHGDFATIDLYSLKGKLYAPSNLSSFQEVLDILGLWNIHTNVESDF